MKNHAILIQTHSNVELLAMLIQRMAAENHYFFIHVDSKTKNYKDFLALSSDHVFYTEKRYNVRWGSIEQIYLTLELIRTVKSTRIKFDYYHLISGQDFPILSNKVFDAFFENNDKSYMELDLHTDFTSRYMLYHFNGLLNVRGKWGGRFERNGIKIQKKIIKYFNIRKPLVCKAYKGSNWWSLNFRLIDYIMSFLEKTPSYLKRFRLTSCCDEVFFHTIAYNSPLKDTIVHTDLRYIDWNKTYAEEKLPRILSELDYVKIKKSNAIFMRKIDLNKSLHLIKMIEANV